MREFKKGDVAYYLIINECDILQVDAFEIAKCIIDDPTIVDRDYGTYVTVKDALNEVILYRISPELLYHSTSEILEKFTKRLSEEEKTKWL